MRGDDSADDLVQQTLLRAFACRHQLRCPSKFRGWLGSIAVNEIRMFRRAARATVSLDESPKLDFADRGPSAFVRCEQFERQSCLQAGIASLAAPHRIAIQLVDIKGLSYSEAAGVMTVSLAAFKSTHHRALHRLGHAVRSTMELPQAA